MEIVADVCSALDFSHRHGIVHRDIKPANVMLNRAGAVKVMDFGIARSVADGQATMTATAAVIGTAQYLSPEQARGEAVDARSDVYATGCVLYELLCGAPPFTGDSPVAIAYQHVREAPRPPSETKPGLPKEMDAIVLKALNKNPLNRYQTAAEMRSDLVRALSGQAVQATPLMSDDERTELMRAAPARVGGASPMLLAPPNRGTVVDEDWEPDPADRSRRVWGFIGIGVLCVALLAGAVWLTAAGAQRSAAGRPGRGARPVRDVAGAGHRPTPGQPADPGHGDQQRVDRREQGQGRQPAAVQPDPGAAGLRGEPGDRQGRQPGQRAQRGQLHPGRGQAGAERGQPAVRGGAAVLVGRGQGQGARAGSRPRRPRWRRAPRSR